MDFREFLKNNIVVLDGGMGTLLQEMGLEAGERPEVWNISRKEDIINIHKRYYDAGSNVVCTNTFGANILKFEESELEKIITAAVENAKEARKLSDSGAEKFIALDIGPSGRLLKPLGDLDFEDAVCLFKRTLEIGTDCGVDLILIETMNDSLETKAALLAAKETSQLPVIVTNAYGSDEKLMTGASPEAMVALLEGMGADALGANCSLGPKQLKGVAERLIKTASIPVVLKPNAGLPKIENGKTVFSVLPKEFSEDLKELIKKGLRVVGGCCGTTPEHIKALSEKVKKLTPKPITDKGLTLVSSYTKAVEFSEKPILIGERINPTGKKRFKQALIENDMDYILSEGVKQEEKGVDILDVNVGLPDINEKEMLKRSVEELQAVTDLPLQIDTADPLALESALRVYNGKAMINSVNGKEESMQAVFPLQKKYGGVIVALTLDENGIPKTAEGRFKIAQKILKRAEDFGVSKKDIVFDTLAMTISADNLSALVTIEAQKRIKEELGCHTSLGVSNVSFGLPQRDAINSTFFALSLASGLSAAIMNPYSLDMMRVYYSYMALNGLDENCAKYIEKSSEFGVLSETSSATVSSTSNLSTLQSAISKGFKEKAFELTEEMLKNKAPLEIVNDEIIPALNAVGKGFEEKKVYLPQLLMSAEAAKSAFESIKKALSESNEKTAEKGVFVIATVKGDIHDIGKNIVKLLLENYGFKVIDLGKDVEPERIVEAVLGNNAPLVGLSALMTTTVPSMEETIKLLRKKTPECKVVVGGAVLTKEYAEKIGADKYAKDAMETVRFAQSIVNK